MTARRPSPARAWAQTLPATRIAAGLTGLSALTAAAALAAASWLALATTSPVWLAGALAGITAVALAGAGLATWLYGRARDLDARASLFGHVFEAAPAGRLILDSSDQASHINVSGRELLGEPEAEAALPALRRALAISEAGAEAFEEMLATARQGRLARADLPVQRSGGGLAWWQIMAEPLDTRAGQILLRLEDVTTQRHDAEAARREQARLHDFLDHAPVGFFSLNEDGQFQLVNATMAQWLGTTPEKLTGDGVPLHAVLATPPHRANPYDIVARGGPEQRGEVTLVGRDGRQFAVFVHQRIVRDEWGRLRTRAVVRDLTPEHEWAAALQSSEQRFRRLFDTAPIGIVLLKRDLAIAECNQAFAALVPSDAPPEALAETAFIDFFRPGDRDKVRERLAAIRDGGEWRGPPLEVHLADARGSAVALIAGREAGNEEDAAGLIVHILDVSEQRELEERFIQSQKMEAVGQLAGGVAHDFNNLLTAMAGFCDLLLQRHKPGDQSFEEVMQIRQNCNRAANLVRQLLAFSRQQQLQPAVVNVTNILDELSHLLRRLLGETIELTITHGRDLGAVKVDPGQLEQVIINLCVNARDALQATPAGGGHLTVVTSNVALAAPQQAGPETIPPGDYVLIEVIDTGTGMSADVQERVFEPFFSTKGAGAGTGLGLSTVYGIVRQTGGYIVVDSAPGEGTRVAIYLPQHSAAAAEEPAPVTDRRPADLTGTGTLLLVEDEDAVRTFAATALRKKGYTVLAAGSGEEGLTLLAEQTAPVDLLITDVVMPTMDGPTLLQRARERQPGMRAIFISGYTADQIAADTNAIGGAMFLAKPFSLKELASAVKDMLAAPEPDTPAAPGPGSGQDTAVPARS